MSTARKVKKRIAPTFVSAAVSNSSADNAAINKRFKHLDENPPLLSLNSPSSTISVKLSNTSPCKSVCIDSHADIQHQFVHYEKIATETYQNWARDPDADWIQKLKNEILDKERSDAGQMNDSEEKLRKLHKKIEVLGSSIGEEDIFGRWELRTEFASEIINLWFDLGNKTLDDVLAKSEELGQNKLPGGGIVLFGSAINERVGLERQDLSKLCELLPIVRSLCPFDGKASLYTVQEDNNFLLRPNQTVTLSEFKDDDETSVLDCSGSLNTTYDYDTSGRDETAENDEDDDDDNQNNGMMSNHPPLDQFYEEMEELTAGLGRSIELNRRLYLIWKGGGYMTPYHQDCHVPPQITLYNQMSGVSVFHFLPVLVGLYVNYIGRKDVNKAQSILQELDKRQVGSVTTLHPGSVAMIFPFSSHGVFVPTDYDPEVRRSACLSTIRAAEFFVKPLLKTYQKELKSETWCCNLMPLSQRDRDVEKSFTASQLELLNKLGIDKQEWHFYAGRMLLNWEREKDVIQKKKNEDLQR